MLYVDGMLSGLWRHLLFYSPASLSMAACAAPQKWLIPSVLPCLLGKLHVVESPLGLFVNNIWEQNVFFTAFLYQKHINRRIFLLVPLKTPEIHRFFWFCILFVSVHPLPVVNSEDVFLFVLKHHLFCVHFCFRSQPPTGRLFGSR